MSMLFANPIVDISVCVGIIFIIIGLFMKFFPPKKINHLYGYRTITSMKSQERWDFAQNYSAKELIKTGFFLVCFGLLVFYLKVELPYGVLIGLTVMILTVIILLIRVERKLKSKFD